MTTKTYYLDSTELPQALLPALKARIPAAQEFFVKHLLDEDYQDAVCEEGSGDIQVTVTVYERELDPHERDYPEGTEFGGCPGYNNLPRRFAKLDEIVFW